METESEGGMSDASREIIEGLRQFAEDIEGGKPLKVTNVYRAPLSTFLQECGLTASRSEGRRLVCQGGVRVNGSLKTDMTEVVILRTGDVIEVGKNRKVVIE